MQHLTIGRPVLETFDSPLLLAVGQHDDVLTVLLHHHPPEVHDCVLLGTLSDNNLVQNLHVVNI